MDLLGITLRLTGCVKKSNVVGFRFGSLFGSVM